MLMYSTVLDFKPSLTKERFIGLVIEWNQNSVHKENRIPDLHYQGEDQIRFGEEDKWMDIAIDHEEQIVAIRFQKREKDHSLWNTDYIAHFHERKLAIRLDHSYDRHVLFDTLNFSTPHFISLLINQGYLVDDGVFPVLRKPLVINLDTLSLLQACLHHKGHQRLPVIYVSKTRKNKDPFDVAFLSSRLKGIAHVLLQENYEDTRSLRLSCDNQIAYNGGINLFFPDTSHQYMAYREYFDDGQRLFNKVTRAILQYANLQMIDPLYTYSGVMNAMLKKKWQSMQMECEQAKNEVSEYLGAFDDDYTKMQKQIEELTRANLSLTQENQGLRAKLSDQSNVPVLYFGEEEDFFPGEIKEMILDAISKQLQNVQSDSRRHDVYQDLLIKNQSSHLIEKRMKEVKNIFHEGKCMSAAMRNKLMDLGFDIRIERKHYKLVYFGDERYVLVVAKTGSDIRAGKNNASMICKKMF